MPPRHPAWVFQLYLSQMEETMGPKSFVIGVAILVGMGIWHVRAHQEAGEKKDSSPDAADLVKHGDYLVNEVAHCSHCHTAPDAKGQPEPSRLLQGTTLGIVPKKKTENWADKAPDITSGGLAGKWSEKDMIKFLTTGMNPDGEKPMPPMPVFHFNARDARAVTLYLKSVPGSKKGGVREKRSKDSE
jgi:mono/diheme cytochrome c family protein